MAFPPAFLATSRQNTTGTKNTHPGDHNKANQAVNDLIRALGATLLSDSYGDKKWKFKTLRAALDKLFNENDDRIAEIEVLGKMNTIRSGSGAPSSGTGKKGDFYINTSALTIYGPKDSKGWGSPTSLRGLKGDTGAPGGRGGPGAPGVDGRIRTVLDGEGGDKSTSTIQFTGPGVTVGVDGGKTVVAITGGGGGSTGGDTGGGAGGGIGGIGGDGSASTDLAYPVSIATSAFTPGRLIHYNGRIYGFANTLGWDVEQGGLQRGSLPFDTTGGPAIELLPSGEWASFGGTTASFRVLAPGATAWAATTGLPSSGFTGWRTANGAKGVWLLAMSSQASIKWFYRAYGATVWSQIEDVGTTTSGNGAVVVGDQVYYVGSHKAGLKRRPDSTSGSTSVVWSPPADLGNEVVAGPLTYGQKVCWVSSRPTKTTLQSWDTATSQMKSVELGFAALGSNAQVTTGGELHRLSDGAWMVQFEYRSGDGAVPSVGVAFFGPDGSLRGSRPVQALIASANQVPAHSFINVPDSKGDLIYGFGGIHVHRFRPPVDAPTT